VLKLLNFCYIVNARPRMHYIPSSRNRDEKMGALTWI
jgi:hypothetical protein